MAAQGASNMTAAQAAAQIRATIDFIASWIYWLAVLALTILFVAAVFRACGIRIPIVPAIADLTLLYLAGAAYLLRR